MATIVSFTLELPYEGVPHAGGEYYLRHVEALVTGGHRVHLIAPATPENVEAQRRAPAGARVTVVPLREGSLGSRLDRARAMALAIWPPAGFLRGVVHDPDLRGAVRSADLIEFQWTQVMRLRGRLRALIRLDAATVGFAHDVVTQGFDRRTRRAGAGRAAAALARWRAQVSRRQEPRLLNGMDAVLVFSEKDRELLIDLGVRRRIEVVRPPLAGLEAAAGGREEDGRTVLFVGAFNRDENTVGAEWLLDRVWPAVLARRPCARLRIVGSQPGPSLRSRAEAIDSVTLTGYVDDLAPEYRRATVAVIPLQHGAGVKFKTVTAMAWGLPVVATTVGIEGVLEGADVGDLGVAVVDDPAGFAAALVAVLDDPAAAAERAVAGREHAQRRFGAAGFPARLNTLYADILRTRQA